MADIESVIAGGVLAIAGSAVTQWLIHVFSTKRERHKLIREKAELICEEVEKLVGWVTERRAKALALDYDPESVPPFGKLVAVQSLYFPAAATEVENLVDKMEAVLKALSQAYGEILKADHEVSIEKEKGGDVEDALTRRMAVSREHRERMQEISNIFVTAVSQLTRKLVALVETET